MQATARAGGERYLATWPHQGTSYSLPRAIGTYFSGRTPLIEIKNISTEDIEIVSVIDPLTHGCRLRPIEMPPRVLRPNEVEAQLGYEPGVSIIVRPVIEPDRPRSGFDG
jgi:hypothetical protein